MSKIRILLADDHKQMREYVSDLLSADCCEVVAAVGDGQAAVDAAVQLVPDVAVLDIQQGNFEYPDQARQMMAVKQQFVPVATIKGGIFLKGAPPPPAPGGRGAVPTTGGGGGVRR